MQKHIRQVEREDRMGRLVAFAAVVTAIAVFALGCGRASPIAEVADTGQRGTGLAQEVHAGDPEVGDAVPDELDHVVGPHEQDVEIEVLDTRDEAPVVFLEDEAGVVEQPQRGLDQPPLVGNGESQSVGHGSFGHARLSRTAR